MRTASIACFLLILHLAPLTLAQESVPWTSMDGPYSGLVQCMVKARDGSLFLGTDVSGVYRSTDDGLSWTQTINGLQDMNVWSLAVEPDGDLLAVSFFEPNEGGSYSPMYRSPRGRLFRSANLGSTWTLIDTVAAGTRLTVGSQGYLWLEIYSDDFGGLVRSTNGGTAWASQALGNAAWIRSLAMDSSGNLYQGVHSSSGIVNQGIHKSTNNGASWTSLSSAVVPLVLAYKVGGYLFLSSTSGISRITTSGSGYVLQDDSWQATSFAFASSGNVYATAADGSVRKSTDDGKSWSVIRASALNAQRIFCPDGVHLFVSAPEAFLSRATESGLRWSNVTKGFRNAVVPSLGRTAAGALFAGTGAEVWKTTNNGGSWSCMTDPPTRPEDYVRGGMGSYPPYYVWAICREYGKTISVVHQTHAYSSVTGGFTRRYGFLSTTTDGGTSWTSVATGIGETSPSGTIRPYAAAVGLGGDVYVGGESAFGRSSGGTFSIVSGSLSGKVVTSLVRDNADRVFAGTVGFGVFRSSDHGDTWTIAAGGLPNLDIYALALDSTGRLYAGSSTGLYTSTNGGTTWATGTGFPSVKVQAIATAQAGHVYVATTDYVYFSSAYGMAPWTKLTTGLPTGDVSSLVIGPDGEVYAGTWGAGVYWRPAWTGATAVPGSGQPENPREFVLEQNYPNPFNPSTDIGFSLPQAGVVSLKVFDILGREITTLVNGWNDAGTHRVVWDARDVVSGVYLCTLTAGGRTQTRRMMVIR